jgi:hypothetical protein
VEIPLRTTRARAQVKAPTRAEYLKQGNKLFNNPFHLNTPQIVELRRRGLLSRLPYITLAEINDKSKSDALVRTITITQILWATVQIIVRATRKLAISQLEIAVAAFAVCAVITYSLNWYKPKGVEIPFTIARYTNELPIQFGKILGEPHDSHKSWFFLLLDSPDRKDQILGRPLGNGRNLRNSGHETVGLVISGVVFGSLHLAAWDLSFPTDTEKFLWLLASIWCTVSIPLAMIILWDCESSEADFELVLVSDLCIAGYILARMFLMVEIFRTLFVLPPTAFTSTWTSNIPHLA